MRELNKYMSPELEEARKSYIEKASKLSPEQNPQELEESWSEYSKKLTQHPHFHHEVQDYESWRAEHPDDVIENMILESAGPKYSFQKDFEQSGEANFEEWKKNLIESKARNIYNAQLDLGLLERDVELKSEEQNPLLAFKDVRKQWANKLAEHYKENIPAVEPSGNQTVTLFIGFPGAGKSRFIEPDAQDADNPVRMTNYGILVDPDEYQRDLVGYLGGAGSQNTLVYAVSVIKPEIQKAALERGNDVVIPLVGGSADTILNEVVNNVIKGYNVRVVIVPTDLQTSHERSLGRARQTGNRLISPTFSGNPTAAFDAAKQMVEDFSTDNNIFVKKLLTKLGYTPAQLKKLGEDDIKKIYDKYKNLISFEIAQ